MSTICERIGSWAANLTEADVPESVRERAALQTASIAAAARAGESEAARFGDLGEAGPLAEVFASGVASIAHDWDDYLYMGHTGHSAVAVSRAFAAQDSARALVAQVAANEVAGRVGLALFVGPHNGQFWAAIHCSARAVAASVGGGLGVVWLSAWMAFKPYPGCAYLQAAVDAALCADVGSAEVREVQIAGGYLTAGMERLGEGAGLRPIGVNFSAKLSVAVALIAGRLTHEELSEDWLAENAHAIRDLAARISVRHDWELTLATLEGAARGGATLRDVPLGAWPRVGRRLRELHMTDLSPGGIGAED